MDISKAKQLLEKYLNGTCTDEERSLIENTYNKFSKETPLPKNDIDFQSLEKEILEVLPQKKKGGRFSVFVTITAAACILLVLSFLGGQIFLKYQSSTPISVLEDVEIVPGGNKATLTLSDGLSIDLNKDKDGIMLLNDQLSYSDGTQIESDDLSSKKGKNLEYTISTPKGGQYQVVLSDGTKVWLNAASSLTYPAKFNDSKVRKVELTGEAFFDVTSSATVPFIVKTARQEIKVLGTQFNINAYEDEEAIKTSLIEGSVRVSLLDTEKGTAIEASEVVLTPNQQSVLHTNSTVLKVREVDVETVAAWKDGLFNFNKSDIVGVMRQLSRWYNVDVSFEGTIPQATFSGKIYRNAEINKVYDLLNYYKITYEVKGRHIQIKAME